MEWFLTPYKWNPEVHVGLGGCDFHLHHLAAAAIVKVQVKFNILNSLSASGNVNT